MSKQILVGQMLLDRDDIEKMTSKIAEELDRNLKDSNSLPVVVGVLKGGAPFMCDIVRKMETIVTLDFISVSSYEGTASTGQLKMKLDISSDIKGRDVVLVDDIVDTGLTTHYLIKYLKEKRGAKSVTTVFLVNKPTNRKYDVQVDFAGLTYTGDKYLIGFGLDYNTLLRNVFGVYLIGEDDIKKLNKILDEDSQRALSQHFIR